MIFICLSPCSFPHLQKRFASSCRKLDQFCRIGSFQTHLLLPCCLFSKNFFLSLMYFKEIICSISVRGLKSWTGLLLPRFLFTPIWKISSHLKKASHLLIYPFPVSCYATSLLHLSKDNWLCFRIVWTNFPDMSW